MMKIGDMIKLSLLARVERLRWRNPTRAQLQYQLWCEHQDAGLPWTASMIGLGDTTGRQKAGRALGRLEKAGQIARFRDGRSLRLRLTQTGADYARGLACRYLLCESWPLLRNMAAALPDNGSWLAEDSAAELTLKTMPKVDTTAWTRAEKIGKAWEMALPLLVAGYVDPGYVADGYGAFCVTPAGRHAATGPTLGYRESPLSQPEAEEFFEAQWQAARTWLEVEPLPCPQDIAPIPLSTARIFTLPPDLPVLDDVDQRVSGVG